MSLKDNFNQAVKEILKKDGLVGKNLSEEAKKNSELDGFLGQNPGEEASTSQQIYGTQPHASEIPDKPAEPPYRGTASAENPPPNNNNTYADNNYANNGYNNNNAANSGYGNVNSNNYNNGYNGGYTEAPPRPGDAYGYSAPYGGSGGGQIPPVGGGYMPPPQPFGAPPSEQRYNDNEETTVISKNIVINGGTITGFANVRIDGKMKGDIKITKDVNVTGTVVGDIDCNNAVMSGSSIQGGVTSKGQIRMDRDSVLIGDLSSQYLDMNGRIKGTVDVSGKAEFKSDSVILGDITASTITVLDGAVIKGYVNTTFLQESSANVFPDTITVTDA